MLEIVQYGDPILRQRCKSVKRVTRDIKRLMEDMLESMREAEGIGLAAPQVGIPLRIVVCGDDEKEYCLVNPRIVRRSPDQEAESEGCLSFPHLRGQVIRPASVKISALDPSNHRVEIEEEGLMCRALCHEIDHLDGSLFIDKVIEDTLHWLVRVEPEDEEEEPFKVNLQGEPYYVRKFTSLEAALDRLLRGLGPEKPSREEIEALARAAKSQCE